MPVRVTRAEWLSRTYATRLTPAGTWTAWRVEIDLEADEPVLPVHLTRHEGHAERHTPWRKDASVSLTVDVRLPDSCDREEASLLVSVGDVLHTGAAWPLVSWPGGGADVGLVAKRDTQDSHGRWRLREIRE